MAIALDRWVASVVTPPLLRTADSAVTGLLQYREQLIQKLLATERGGAGLLQYTAHANIFPLLVISNFKVKILRSTSQTTQNYQLSYFTILLITFGN